MTSTRDSVPGSSAGGVVSNHPQLELEIEFLAEHRWWTLDELRCATERILPDGFADLVAPLIAGDWPREPVRLASVDPEEAIVEPESQWLADGYFKRTRVFRVDQQEVLLWHDRRRH